MKVEIKIPPLGESVSEAVVSRILCPAGSMVRQDQEILELETDKVNQVLYAPASGKIELSVALEQTVAVGAVIGFVDTAVEHKEVAPEVKKPPQEPIKEEKKEVKQAPPAPKSTSSARKMVDDFIHDVQAPHPKEICMEHHKTQQIEQKPQASSSRKKMSGLRKTIAQKLVEVKNSTAMLTTFNEVDMSAVMEIRAKEKDSFLKKHNVKLGFMSFFVKAAVAALKAYPQVNAMIEGDDIVSFTSFDIGVAVSTEKGLLVPIIRGCDDLSFSGVEKEIERFAKKAREGSIAIDDLRGGTFTITNGGIFGSMLSTPILNPPQSAILGMHAITKRAVVVNDQIVIRPMMYLALSYDHRIIDGKEAVGFLMHIKESLEDPSRLLLDL